jgi:uncharacterized protein (DUF433 family)
MMVRGEKTMLSFLPLESDPLPIRLDTSGALRIGETRVTVETVLQSYLAGDSPEVIQGAFEGLELADIYAVIAHYLRHRDEFDQYLRMYEIKFEMIRATSDQSGLKDRLLSRLAARQTEDASIPSGS